MLKPVPIKRESQIDTLRGIALFCMILANMAPYLLVTPHPLFERLIGSSAAPLFITLAGMMASLSRYKPAHGFKYFITRGSFLIVIGCILDATVNHVVPMASMDVLYLIGSSLIISYPLIFIKAQWRLVLALLVFLVTPALQKFYGYHAIPIINTLTLSWQNAAEIAQATLLAWGVEGYFPLFPWFGYFLIGTALGSMRWTTQGTHYFNNLPFLIFSLCLFVGGATSWIMNFTPPYIRDGYSELFYPATWSFIATSLGLILTLFYLVDSFPNKLFYWPLQIYGKASLFIYITHATLITYVLHPLFSPQPIISFLGLYIVLCGVLLLLAWALDKIRPQLRGAPFPVRFILGA
ncbi:MAG: hypothetical protein A3E83_01610 [Gammaproteobacteria bacterium RIFCSPHIGHO2_12_FULL_41_20]|nr:MAG: hypothetical protein A3E83_01610 [Gammaproteobacteria bacterium RIFCSPHIGHO2_12_FULL_41_20]